MPSQSKRNRISVLELLKMFPDDKAAREWLEQIRWKDGRFCLTRGSTNTRHNLSASEKLFPYHCRDCHRISSIKTGAVLLRSKNSMQQWAIGIYSMSTSFQGTSSMKLHRELGIGQKATQKMTHKIREGWDQCKSKLLGSVEVDEACFGGKESNKHKSKKLPAGRGAVGEDAVVGINKQDGKIRVERVTDTTSEALHRQLLDNVKEGTKVYSNEHKGYGGTCHKMSSKHLHCHVAEFVGRHNMRNMDTINQMEHITSNFDAKRLLYKGIVADNRLDAVAI